MAGASGGYSMAGDKSLSGITVLLVDDHADTLDTIAMLLRQAGALVEAARSAQEAFDALQARPADILISDLQMPGATGYNLVRRIRQVNGPRSLPALAITGQDISDARDRALQAGFDAFLGKPILGTELLRVVGRLVFGGAAAAPGVPAS